MHVLADTETPVHVQHLHGFELIQDIYEATRHVTVRRQKKSKLSIENRLTELEVPNSGIGKQTW